MSRLLDISVVRKALDWSPERDQEVADIIDDVTAEMEELTHKSWLNVTDAEKKFRLEKHQHLIVIPCRPLTSVTVVGWAIQEEEPADYTDALIQDTDYDVDLTLGTVKLYPYTATLYEFVKVKYSGGFSSSTLPRRARQAMLMQIQYQAIRENTDNIVAETRVVEKSSARLRSGHLHPRFEQFCKNNKRCRA